MSTEDLIKHLPKAHQVFYKICKEAGLESNIIEKDDNVESQIFNKKSKYVQKTFFLDNEGKNITLKLKDYDEDGNEKWWYSKPYKKYKMD